MRGEVSPYAAMVARRAQSTHATIRVYPHSGGSIAAPATPWLTPTTDCQIIPGMGQ